ncbi:Na(+)-translocating NADH-quinone reductase subunit C [Bacteriovoracaceae bacterium]|nr:Na(+)-translocating NADH-quinone reductase subunit C [Bacteriovoracaceae bacterium]
MSDKKSSNEALRTIFVALSLCLVCSIAVSVTVVNLKPRQDRNKDLDLKKNILSAAGLHTTYEEIESNFSKIKIAVVDLERGQIDESIDPDTYNENKAKTDPDAQIVIPADIDVGGLVKRLKKVKVYLVQESGTLKQVILPIVSKGLWSTMYGFISLSDDLNTVKGFAYYSQGETPGLGGEVDNPAWKEQWIGKKIFSGADKIAFKVAKGAGKGVHQVDGLSGATITANGVTNSIRYWMSDHGFGKFLNNLKGVN